MKILHPALAGALGVLGGWLIWKLAPNFAGMTEPWDSKGLYYPVALFFAGALASVVSPRNFWAAGIGVWAGQLAYGVTLSPSPFWPIGVAFAGFFSGVALLGGVFVYGIARLLNRKGRAGPP